MIIVGIDPGNGTGIALYDTVLQHTPLTWEIDAENVGWWMRQTAGVLHQEDKVFVIGERYVMTNSLKTSQPAALEVMGVMKDQCRVLGWDLTWVSVKTNKKTADDALLRRLGWYLRTKDGHANDGVRLVLCGLLSHAPEEFARLTGI